MRTLSHMPQHKQSEQENLSFMYTNAHDRAKVKGLQNSTRRHEKELVEAKKILMKTLENDQYLELITVKKEVHSVFKEPYRMLENIRGQSKQSFLAFTGR
ncbi:hypothetical protein Syun_018992 [Stephania yunnanensis]|uniref:Uncharacterized protein n=1 Tax=Stephania yunnanensis TaxID=152371 RepID=A0AAP0NXI8_9MAGN